MNDKDLRQAGDAEDLQQTVLGADQVERAVVGPDLLQPADQDSEAGRVQELDVLHVDDDVVGPGGDQLGELVAQAGRRVDVDLAPDGDDSGAVGLAGRKSQVHVVSTAFVCAQSGGLPQVRARTPAHPPSNQTTPAGR